MCHCRCIPHPHACAMYNRKVGGVQVREARGRFEGQFRFLVPDLVPNPFQNHCAVPNVICGT